MLAASTPDGAKKEQKPKFYLEEEAANSVAADPVVEFMRVDDLKKLIAQTQKAMTEAAKNLDFIEAAQLRDELIKLKEQLSKRETP